MLKEALGGGTQLDQQKEEGMGILWQEKGQAFPRSRSLSLFPLSLSLPTHTHIHLHFTQFPAPHLTAWNSFPASNSNPSCGGSLRQQLLILPARSPGCAS